MSEFESKDDLYHLSVQTFTWTKIRTGLSQPLGCLNSSLIPLIEKQLVLYVGEHEGWPVGEVWIFDLQSLSWWQHTAATKARGRSLHTGTVGIDNSIIIVGGYNEYLADGLDLLGVVMYMYSDVISVKLEPKNVCSR